MQKRHFPGTVFSFSFFYILPGKQNNTFAITSTNFPIQMPELAKILSWLQLNKNTKDELKSGNNTRCITFQPYLSEMEINNSGS